MKYPSNSKKNYNKIIEYSNRGMNLEKIINEANKYYLDNNIALIYKKPTPVQIVKTNNNKITESFYKEKSTLDFVGLYKGRYIEFDAKETKQNYLPLSNIKDHQLLHIKKIIEHNGISFIIIHINKEYYLLNGEKIIDFINNNDRKSIPYDYIKENSKKLNYNYIKGLDYIKYLEV